MRVDVEVYKGMSIKEKVQTAKIHSCYNQISQSSN